MYLSSDYLGFASNRVMIGMMKLLAKRNDPFLKKEIG